MCPRSEPDDAPYAHCAPARATSAFATIGWTRKTSLHYYGDGSPPPRLSHNDFARAPRLQRQNSDWSSRVFTTTITATITVPLTMLSLLRRHVFVSRPPDETRVHSVAKRKLIKSFRGFLKISTFPRITKKKRKKKTFNSSSNDFDLSIKYFCWICIIESNV